ncbi:sigma-70 family RNA polymerase sigma factor [Desulfovibrio ferrophilus]|uniref:RNA polymerase sigma factor, sigma-70 family protein n=1 Tax=Desulfovibrio ferrophilus TaxID=241368 RepID=A0A2Z6AUE6_9BACT|nr:sigma-70 family RNA polymerase sigma factor [Desulfovibrio ferrophilus]BBD06806.1 RNA polymerase sigma factor, sigma-70 family protein [Desulfovibrio ferrophilus]
MAQAREFDKRNSPAQQQGNNLDTDGFAKLISELMPGMLVRAGRILLSREEAQDVVQEALIIAFTRLDQIRDVNSFPGWLRSIVDSQCYRHLRKRGKEVSLEGLDRYQPLAPKALDPASRYEQRCFKAAVNHAFLQLSAPLRDVCLLYYESGHSIDEIADILAVNKGTVRKRLHSAQPRLASMLKDQMGETAIRVGYLPISDHLLGMVAHRLSKGRHSRIHMKRFLSWSVLAEALKQRRIDAAFIMAPLAMQLCNSGTHLKYVLDGHHDGSALAASTNKLQGKLVGVPGPYSTHRVLLGKLANEAPKLWENINTADTNPSYAIRSLKSQTIDAFFCAEPWSTKCVCEGDANVFIRSKDLAPGHPCCVVAVREDFCQAHPNLVSEYVCALLRARDKIHTDIKYCAETQAIYTGIQSELAARVLEGKVVTFDNLHPDKNRMAKFMKLALASGVLSAPCDLDQFVCNKFR